MDRAISAGEGHFIAGFIEGEGHLAIAEANGAQSFRCLMSLRVRDDDTALLEWLHARTGLGLLRAVPARATSKPQVQWLVQTQSDCQALVELLTRFPIRGRKRVEFDLWRAAVELWCSPVMDRVRREDALAVLRRWAAEEPGTLSSSRYAKVRQPGWPTRNTIAHRFGSWDAALRAAGLAERLARPTRHPIGGAAPREARAAAQRERVLQTLRYLILVHGSVPTAMQFFRWRLIEAPATPTQATVYRLFPGGWQAVLDALGPVDPRVLCEPSPTT